MKKNYIWSIRNGKPRLKKDGIKMRGGMHKNKKKEKKKKMNLRESIPLI
jgi:hypothetical protein